MKIFDFSLPIGWSELSAIATTAAVVIALYSNRKTTKQMKITIQTQEQAKNVELAEKRIDVLNSVLQETDISDLTLRILFDWEIYECYLRWREAVRDENRARADRDTFFELWEIYEEEKKKNEHVKERMEEYKQKMAELDYPDEIEREYEQYCTEHKISAFLSKDTGEVKEYDYLEIEEEIEAFESKRRTEKKQLLSLMEAYIKRSIEAIDASTESGRWARGRRK